MGYYTTFTGWVTGPPEDVDAFRTVGSFSVDSGYVLDSQDFVSGEPLFGYEGVKWYSYDDDMKVVSQKYPSLTFELEGEGEESGDFWRSWYKNGRSVSIQGQVTFPTPDLSVLN
jgi:hypothetical protein